MYKKGKSFLICTFSFLNYRSKYFRGKRIHGDYDIRVEQAEFKELSVNCNTEGGVTASIILAKSGNKVVRSFKPDFLLVRQNVRDTDEDHRNILLGFQYGNLPSVNTLDSIYNFQVRHDGMKNLLQIAKPTFSRKFLAFPELCLCLKISLRQILQF